MQPKKKKSYRGAVGRSLLTMGATQGLSHTQNDSLTSLLVQFQDKERLFLSPLSLTILKVQTLIKETTLSAVFPFDSIFPWSGKASN